MVNLLDRIRPNDYPQNPFVEVLTPLDLYFPVSSKFPSAAF